MATLATLLLGGEGAQHARGGPQGAPKADSGGHELAERRWDEGRKCKLQSRGEGGAKALSAGLTCKGHKKK